MASDSLRLRRSKRVFLQLQFEVFCICICSSKLHLSLRSILAAGALSSYMKARLELDHVISDLICTD